MDPLQRVAFISVSRGCAFAGLAILTTVIGLSFNPQLAAISGGVLTLLTVFVLLIKGYKAQLIDHRRTEAWLLLDERDRPPPAQARVQVAAALQKNYQEFAHHYALAAIIFFATSTMIGFARFFL